MGKAETSSYPGQSLRTGDTRQTAVRDSAAGERFMNKDPTLMPTEVKSLGQYICPAHSRERVAQSPTFRADQKALDHLKQAQAKQLFW